MANRKVTKDVSDSQIASAVLASFPLNKLDRIVEAHATDKDKVKVTGSNLIPMRIGDNWFLIDTDTNVTLPADLDDYVADVVIEDGAGTWTPSTNVLFSNDAGQVKLHIEDAFATGLLAYKDFAAQDWSATGKRAISFLITSSVNLAAGVLSIVYDEDSGCVSTSESLVIGALKANVQTRVIMSMTAASAARDAVISVGLNAVTDPGHIDVWIDDIKITTLESAVNYYVYACDSTGTLVFKISKASTFPSGFDATSSRKIGGFHTLCRDVGTISGHTLTTYTTGSILPASIWDLKHRPRSQPEGMAWVSTINKWVDIYLTSGTGASTASADGATISDTRTWLDFADDYAAVGKRFLDDLEFQAAAAGSNEETNILGSADPVTTGRHLDTAYRRMISNFGLEDCCGAMFQWLRDQSYQCNPDGTVTAAALTFAVVHTDSPEGAVIYLKQGANGVYYLASDLATDADKYIGPTNYKVPIKYEADPSTGAIGQVYFDDDGTAPARLLCNIATITKDAFIPTNNPSYFLQIKHDASAATNGVALYYDNVTHHQLECNNANNVDANLDLALNSQAWAYYDLPGSKGSLYKQGTYGDVKLLAGGLWNASSRCGSRCRSAAIFRWYTTTNIGGRALADAL